MLPTTPTSAARFLSTFPLRGTSPAARPQCSGTPNFYPRSPCGERPSFSPLTVSALTYFYPRSPCGERQTITSWEAIADVFLSTFPLRGTSYIVTVNLYCQPNFYPRSPCGERRPRAGSRAWPDHFYPRSPCGERRMTKSRLYYEWIFLSTFPLRGTSYFRERRHRWLIFLSTFPLRGTSANCDRLLPLVCKSIGNSKHSVLAAWLTRGVITPDSLSGMGAKISGGF